MIHTQKDRLAKRQSQSIARQTDYEEMSRARPGTWSAQMPAYAGTVLCPDERYRVGMEKRGETIGNVS